MQTQKPMATMEDWAVVSEAKAGGYQELVAGNILAGKVFGHSRIAEGSFVFSSPILHFDEHTGIVETRNTAYRLGAPNQAYRDCAKWTNGRAGTEAA